MIHLFERDCSVQRRHQKVIEESPAPAVDPELRERIGKIGTEAARAVGYRSAGTIEGLLADGEYFFLEMNTRVQVEHCVTEMVTGIDIVREQLKIAAGEPLAYGQDDVAIRGHAIECRINAEDASKNFAPAPGRIESYREPAGPFVRVDSGAEAGYEVLPLYDPMIAKLIVWDVDREASTHRMLRALGEYEIGGLKTLIPFHQALLQTEQWQAGETCRDLVEDKKWLKQLAFPAAEKGAAEEAEEKVTREYAVEVSGRRFDVRVIGEAGGTNGASASAAKQAPRRERKSGGGGGAPGELVSPIQGTVLKVAVEQGATVDEGALICVIEAMKMENEITAPLVRDRGAARRLRGRLRGHRATRSPSSSSRCRAGGGGGGRGHLRRLAGGPAGRRGLGGHAGGQVRPRPRARGVGRRDPPAALLARRRRALHATGPARPGAVARAGRRRARGVRRGLARAARATAGRRRASGCCARRASPSSGWRRRTRCGSYRACRRDGLAHVLHEPEAGRASRRPGSPGARGARAGAWSAPGAR